MWGIYDLARFIEGLAEAGRGVVRITVDQDAVASGWLITPTLVATCDFIAEEIVEEATAEQASRADFLCDNNGDVQQAVPGRVVHAPSEKKRGRLPALIRLERPIPGTEPFRLDLAAVPPGSRLTVVHHPRGLESTKLSFGMARDRKEDFLNHTADTEPGSSGGAVLRMPSWGVVAMHVGGTVRQGYNFALPLPAILDGLRASADWPEIAERHELADVAAVRQATAAAEPTLPAAPPAAAALVAAAMRWSLDPAELTNEERESLRPLVIDPEAPRWSLPVPQRQTLLRGAGSLAELRALRRARPATEPGHEIIDRILDGPPFDLEQEPLDALPRWLQAVRWFDGVVPELPSAAQVHRTMERRRVREQLASIAGPGFRGRTEDLATLNAWFTGPRPGPMAISGIGGVGKSALVARFAELLPAAIPLFWLDFDRVDLAPDDAVSLMTALGTQAAVQLDGFTAPEVDAASWAPGVSRFGMALTAAAPGPALLVLDGFEIAQHVARHQEIWPVLTMLLDSAPQLRLLVSGRAPVSSLQLGHRRATNLHLTGLDPVVAADWLADGGVVDPAVRDRVVTASRGIPLVLKLAMRLLDAGGTVDDLPGVMVEGYLYHRILDRVVDEDLRPIARDVLQLRVLTAEMLAAVLPDRIPLGADPVELSERLTHELAIVESLDEAGPADAESGQLRLRPEVRSAVLQLLTVSDAERVVTIDRRAADWWAARATDDPTEAAEHVYHRLRLGDVPGAAAAWRPGCAAHLTTAADDVSDPAARNWLLNHLEEDATDTPLASWEQDAASRIYQGNRRGLERSISRVLDERPERTAASPLLVYDAWVRWQRGDPAGAAALLDATWPAKGQTARDRTLVRAGLAVAAREEAAAERLLAEISSPTLWAEPLEAYAVLAARIRLTVDLEDELKLAELPAGLWTGELPDGGLITAIRRLVVPGDVILPSLAENIAGPEELEASTADVHELRRRLRKRWPETSDSGERAADVEPALDLARRLGDLGERRWQLATTTPALAGLTEEVSRTNVVSDPLSLAVLASLAAFRGLPLTLSHGARIDIDNLLGGTMFDAVASRVAGLDVPELVRSVMASEERTRGRSGGMLTQSAATRTVLLYVLSGDPLLLLIHRVLGLPTTSR